jgi:hypothetical protein
LTLRRKDIEAERNEAAQRKRLKKTEIVERLFLFLGAQMIIERTTNFGQAKGAATAPSRFSLPARYY